MAAGGHIVACGLEVFPQERLVLVEGRAVDLTSREFDIVNRLAAHPGWVYTPEQLADAEGADGTDFSPESISVHVSHLRRKLTDAGACDVVRTVRGVGYQLKVDADHRFHSAAREESDFEGQVAAGRDDRDLSGQEADRSLRDSFWLLEEAVMQAEHAGSAEQLTAAREALDAARRAIYGVLAE